MEVQITRNEEKVHRAFELHVLRRQKVQLLATTTRVINNAGTHFLEYIELYLCLQIFVEQTRLEQEAKRRHSESSHHLPNHFHRLQ